jgi:hypothetical protein
MKLCIYKNMVLINCSGSSVYLKGFSPFLFFGSNLSLALETKLPRNPSLELLKCDINSVGGKATK